MKKYARGSLVHHPRRLLGPPHLEAQPLRKPKAEGREGPGEMGETTIKIERETSLPRQESRSNSTIRVPHHLDPTRLMVEEIGNRAVKGARLTSRSPLDSQSATLGVRTVVEGVDSEHTEEQKQARLRAKHCDIHGAHLFAVSIPTPVVGWYHLQLRLK